MGAIVLGILLVIAAVAVAVLGWRISLQYFPAVEGPQIGAIDRLLSVKGALHVVLYAAFHLAWLGFTFAFLLTGIAYLYVGLT